ncbi:hypothetical protein SFRURICE_013249, partial [Spodoptera frugiperda]
TFSRVRIPGRAKYYWAFFGFSKISLHGVWNCVQDMAIGSPPITWVSNKNGEKVGVHCVAALRVVMCTSAYPFGDKRREVDCVLCRGCVYKHTSSHTHDTGPICDKAQNNNLWITQRVLPYRNQTRYTLVAAPNVQSSLNI